MGRIYHVCQAMKAETGLHLPIPLHWPIPPTSFTHRDRGHSDSSFLTRPSSQLNERKSKPVFLPPAFLLLILLASRSAPNPSQHVLRGRPSHRGPLWLSRRGVTQGQMCAQNMVSALHVLHTLGDGDTI